MANMTGWSWHISFWRQTWVRVTKSPGAILVEAIGEKMHISLYSAATVGKLRPGICRCSNNNIFQQVQVLRKQRPWVSPPVQYHSYRRRYISFEWNSQILHSHRNGRIWLFGWWGILIGFPHRTEEYTTSGMVLLGILRQFHPLPNTVPQKAETRQSIPTSSGSLRISLHCTITSVRPIHALQYMRRRRLTSIMFRFQWSVMAPVRIRITLRTTVLTMVQNDSTHLTRLGYIPVNHVRPFSFFGWLVRSGYPALFISHGGTCMFEFFILSCKGHLQLTQRQQLRQSISIFRCGLFPESVLAKVIKVSSV